MKQRSHICICETFERFRPSDWAHRLAGLDALFGADRRLRFSSLLQPVRHGERQCLRVDNNTQTARPELWQEVLAFAGKNGLQVKRVEV